MPAVATGAAVRPASRTLDAKRATHDGYIWPRARHHMTDGVAIRDRMAEDARAFEELRGDFEGITERYFWSKGWTPEQVEQHGAAVIEEVTSTPISRTSPLFPGERPRAA
ncbi:hypothetical protein [Labrys sp. (in: a-proteobacteria)]|uniref:hypothetical protein n=1 Tax=Labrys sp. (in: a-proteobacteria) TaxID=1917972 RepID=UPI0039E3E5B3